MARYFEIHSERQRQIVVAVVMGVLFAASIAAAAWFTTAQHRRARQVAMEREPALEQERTGDFTLLRPAAWSAMEPADEDPQGEHVRELARWRELSGPDRRLALLEVRHENPLPPGVALDLVMAMGNGDASSSGSRVGLRSETMTGLLAERVGVRDNGEMVSQLLTALTLDGRRHAVLVLERSGERREHDLRLMVEIARSVADTRYSRLEGANITLDDGFEAPLPASLTAVEGPSEAQGEADRRPRRLLIPAREARFFFIQPRIVRLSGEDAESLARAAAQAEQADGDDDPLQLSEQEWRVALTLAEAYVQMTGEQPPERSVQPMDLDGRRAFSITLPDEGVGSSTSVWAVGVGEQQVMLLQVTSDAAAAAHAHAAARAFIAANEPA